MSSVYVTTDAAGVMRVGRAGVMLDSVLAGFEQGHSPETIRAQYPSLTLEEVYGAIAWALGHAGEVEQYLRRQDSVWEQGRRRADADPPAVVRRLRALRNAGTGVAGDP